MISIVILISTNREDLADDIINKHFLMLQKIKTNNLNNFVLNNGKSLSHATHLIVDLPCLNDNNDEIVSAINTLGKIYMEMRIIILADSDTLKTENRDLLRRIYEKGVLDILTDVSEQTLEKSIVYGMTEEETKDFIVERPDLSSLDNRKKQADNLKEEQEENLLIQQKLDEERRLEQLNKHEIIMPNKDFRKYKPYVSVAVCGTEAHIGATHNAILITKFLTEIGFKACYLEANEIQKIFYLKSLYPQKCNFNERKNLLQCFGTDIYSGFNIADVLAEKYDVYVFDLGVLNDVKLTSFLTKDIRILVSGSKAWEINKLKELLPLLGVKNIVNFMFNYLIPNEEQKICNIMGELRKLSFFSQHVENPFTTGVNLNAYKNIFKEYILQNEIATIEKPKKHKFKLF